jgi:hypothetical protein
MPVDPPETGADPVRPRIFVAALTTLLLEALGDAQTTHLASDRLKEDLQGLRTRVENELEVRVEPRRLHLASAPGS